jgi:hypothetical protein
MRIGVLVKGLAEIAAFPETILWRRYNLCGEQQGAKPRYRSDNPEASHCGVESLIL